MLTYEKFIEDIDIQDNFVASRLQSVFNIHSRRDIILWKCNPTIEPETWKLIRNTLFHVSRKLQTRICVEQTLYDSKFERNTLNNIGRRGREIRGNKDYQVLCHYLQVNVRHMMTNKEISTPYEAYFFFHHKSKGLTLPLREEWSNKDSMLFDIEIG